MTAERKESLLSFILENWNSWIFLKNYFFFKNARNKLFANEWQQRLEFVHLCIQLSFLYLGCLCCTCFHMVVVHFCWFSPCRSLTLCQSQRLPWYLLSIFCGFGKIKKTCTPWCLPSPLVVIVCRYAIELSMYIYVYTNNLKLLGLTSFFT